MDKIDTVERLLSRMKIRMIEKGSGKMFMTCETCYEIINYIILNLCCIYLVDQIRMKAPMQRNLSWRDNFCKKEKEMEGFMLDRCHWKLAQSKRKSSTCPFSSF